MTIIGRWGGAADRPPSGPGDPTIPVSDLAGEWTPYLATLTLDTDTDTDPAPIEGEYAIDNRRGVIWGKFYVSAALGARLVARFGWVGTITFEHGSSRRVHGSLFADEPDGRVCVFFEQTQVVQYNAPEPNWRERLPML